MLIYANRALALTEIVKAPLSAEAPETIFFGLFLPVFPAISVVKEEHFFLDSGGQTSQLLESSVNAPCEQLAVAKDCP